MKKILRILLIIIVIALIICAGAFVRKSKQQKQDVEKVVNEFCQAYKNKDTNISNYMVDQYEFTYDGFQGSFTKHFDYKIKKIKKENQGYTVSLELTNVDFEKIITDFNETINKDADEKEALKQFEKAIEDENAAIKTYEVETDVIMKEKDTYQIVVSNSMGNAMLGGYPEFIDGLVSEQGEEIK